MKINIYAGVYILDFDQLKLIFPPARRLKLLRAGRDFNPKICNFEAFYPALMQFSPFFSKSSFSFLSPAAISHFHNIYSCRYDDFFPNTFSKKNQIYVNKNLKWIPGLQRNIQCYENDALVIWKGNLFTWWWMLSRYNLNRLENWRNCPFLSWTIQIRPFFIRFFKAHCMWTKFFISHFTFEIKCCKFGLPALAWGGWVQAYTHWAPSDSHFHSRMLALNKEI